MTFTLCRPQTTPRRGHCSNAGETGVGRRGPKAPMKWPVLGIGEEEEGWCLGDLGCG